MTRVRRYRSRACRILGTGLLAACVQISALAGAQAEPSHGLSVFGALKYPADFKHFEYVNPDAPKGGAMSMIGTSGLNTFDSFNAFLLKGDPAQGLSLLFDTLMARAADEPDAVYGLVAHSAEVAPDKMSVTFYLRPEARFADGTPVTSADVAYSFKALKTEGHPAYRILLRDVEAAEEVDPLTVRYRFKGTQVRDLPIVVAGLPILSKAYYGKHKFAATSLDPPLGSGPYTIGKFKQGAFVEYERRTDYWAKDLAVNRGRFNIDKLRYIYFRDRTAELEALKAGTFDLREEFTSRDWANAYKGEQVTSGKLKLLTLPDERPSGAQGFFINMRRAKFADVRVRKAFDLAFDFEWTNKNLFFNLYKRTASFFENSEMKATGKPSAGELALLEPHRKSLPGAVFGEVYKSPVTSGSGHNRKFLQRALTLLKQAGWTQHQAAIDDPDCGMVCKVMITIGLKSQKTEPVLRNAKGETLDVEFLTYSPTMERIIAPYVRNLVAIGIKASIRRVDTAQFQRRLESFDFDIIVQRYALRLTPGIELRTYWSSRAASIKGSRNLAGIKNPVVDALIEKVIAAKSRKELVTAARALDRVLRADHCWVPHWYKAAHNIAYWDKFSRPKVKPRYARGVIDTWWYDAKKAAGLAAK